MTVRETKKNPNINPKNISLDDKVLILHNDDYHTFDYVINALIDVCNHDYVQATQCTMITHYKGKCDVKTGEYKSLKLMKEGLVDLELKATIE
jgi:ATP-dependent Clp protease adaptor protein ClpS